MAIEQVPLRNLTQIEVAILSESLARLGEVETKRGVEGYGATQEQLEKVSKEKANVDEAKSKTLDETAQAADVECRNCSASLSAQAEALASRFNDSLQHVEQQAHGLRADLDGIPSASNRAAVVQALLAQRANLEAKDNDG